MVLKEDDLRQSYVQLIEEYGGILPTIAGKRPLRPRDFFENGRLNAAGREWVDRVLSFELTALSRGESTQRRISDYLQMIGESSEIPQLEPEFLVAPYFHASSIDDEWYSISLEMAKCAASRRKTELTVPVICLSDRVLLDEDSIDQVVADYAEFPSVLLWISEFDESHSSETQLMGYGRLVQQLAERGVAPMALYGGFYALMLSAAGLKGVSSGVCYAEWKGVARQASGGGPPIRYYVPWAHTKVVKANAITYYAANPSEFCKCSVCRSLLNTTTARGASAKIAEAFDLLDRALAGRHFMRIRAQELQLYGSSTKAASLRSLESDRQHGERKSAATLGVPTSQLKKWCDSLERL